MANHVTTWMVVDQASPAVYQRLKEMFKDATSWESFDSMKFYEILYPEYAGEDYSREEFTNRMGAKWCYVEEVDCDDDSFTMTTISAWSWSHAAFQRLHKILNEIDDEDVIMTATYEDEGYNFVGGAAIKNTDDLYDYDDETLEWPEDAWENDEVMDAFYEKAGDSMASCRDEAYDDATWSDDEDEIEDSEEYDEE